MICLCILHWESTLIWVLWSEHNEDSYWRASCQWVLWLLKLPNTNYFLRHSPVWLLWCWKRELFMKPFHSNHVPMISEFSDVIIWYKNFSKLNRTGTFCPVWILSNQTISGQKPFMLWLYSWDFFHVWVLMLKTHDEKDFLHSGSPVWAFS